MANHQIKGRNNQFHADETPIRQFGRHFPVPSGRLYIPIIDDSSHNHNVGIINLFSRRFMRLLSKRGHSLLETVHRNEAVNF